MPPYAVHSFHINVAVGDCAIHLLVDEGVANFRILSTVLLDGGSTQRNPFVGASADPSAIRRTIAWIETVFKLKEKTLKINTVVISHWDEDHYGGIRKTLIEDARTARESNTPIPYLYWAGDGSPQTIFYAPNREATSQLNGPDSMEDLRVNKKTGNLQVLFRENKFEDTHWADIGRFRYADNDKRGIGDWEVLGANFFNNELMAAPQAGKEVLAADLFVQNPPRLGRVANTALPAMYCIGVRERTLPFKPPTLRPTLIRETVTKTNRVSIVSGIFWRDRSGAVRCSHYSGGDANEKVEDAVFYWFQKSGIKKITTMKLSHHGSRSSTSNLQLFLMPLNIIISNPTGKYFHPGWEVIFMLAVWAKMYYSNDHRFIALKYPFYFDVKPGVTNGFKLLADDSGTNKLLNTKAFDDHSHKAYRSFQDLLDQSYQRLMTVTRIINEKDEYDRLKKEVSGTKKSLLYLLSALATRWDEHCYPRPKFEDYPSNHEAKAKLAYDLVRIVSRADQANDGEFHIKKYDDPELYVPSTNVRQQATKSKKVVTDVRRNIGYNKGCLTSNIPTKKLKRDGQTLSNGLFDHWYDYDVAFIPNMYEGNVFGDVGENINEVDKYNEQWEWNVDFARLTKLMRERQKSYQPSSAPDPDPDTGFYIMSSTTGGEGPADRFVKLPTSDPWDWLLGTSGGGVLRLEGDTFSDETENIRVVGDEIGAWLEDSMRAHDVAIIKAPKATTKGIGGFQFHITIARTTSQNQPAPFLDILFTTRESALERAFGSSKPAMGVRDGSTMLVLAADSALFAPAVRSDVLSITLIDLAKFAELSWFDTPLLTPLHPLAFVIPPADALDEQRNVVWFVPQQAFRTVIRLELNLETSQHHKIRDFLKFLDSDFVIKKVTAIVKKDCRRVPRTNEICIDAFGSLCLCIEARLTSTEKLKLRGSLDFKQDSIEFALVLDTETSKALDAMVSWLKKCLRIEEEISVSKWLNQKIDFISFPKINFRRVTIVLEQKTGQEKDLQFKSFAIDVEVTVTTKDDPVLFLFTYRYTNSKASFFKNSYLEARLWVASARSKAQLAASKQLPNFEEHRSLTPVSVTSLPTSLDLKRLACFENAPDQIPTQLVDAQIFLSGTAVGFKGALQRQENLPKASIPQIGIKEIDLAVTYTFADAKVNDKTSGFTAELDIRSYIQPPPGSPEDAVAASVQGSFKYERGLWSLDLNIGNLPATYLLQFFSDEVQDAVVDILKPFEIQSFRAHYDYKSNDNKASKAASNLAISSVLKIGDLALALDYSHKGDPWAWSFSAIAMLQLNDRPTNFRAVMNSILGEGDHGLPEFVQNIPLNVATLENVYGLVLAPDMATQSVIFIFVIKIKDFILQYVQISYRKDKKPGAKPPKPTKRVILASVSSLPTIDVALIGKISQPFDEASFIWVQRQDESQGLTESEVDAVNRIMDSQKEKWPGLKPLRFKKEKKPSRKDPAMIADDPVHPTVINGGLHFMLALKNEQNQPNIVIDYVFGENKMKKKTLIRSGRTRTKFVADETPGADTGTMQAYPKTVGPLAIRNIGFELAGKKLAIKMDASVTLGPMSFDLFGFAIGLDFGAKGEKPFNLENLPPPEVSLRGLSVAYDRNPLRIEGGLIFTKTDDTKLFAGAILVSYTPWLFAAAGFYGEVKFPNSNVFKKTAFVYAMLEGPLVTFFFGQINGLKGGFGYNSSLRYPTAADIPNFPLIPKPQPAGTEKGPQDSLMSIVETGWVSPKEDSFWVAAGVKVTAFQMLEVDVLITVQWGPSIQIGLFAVAMAMIPKPIPGVKASVTFAFIQLGITAVIDIGAGTVAIDGQLTPASFILHKDCHLSGGFALYTWFGDSPHSGDWVLSLGGYHRLFKPPPHYPVPPRLVISWKFSNAISIRGEAYFAVTPQVCMGGGRWNVSLSLGPLQAYYEAFVDFLINFRPFHFMADGGLAVGVRFTLDLWLVTLYISVDIAAQLHIEGPPMRGTVHVDFWVFGFDIKFGAEKDEEATKLSLRDFKLMILEAKDSGNPASTFDTITAYTPLVGMLPSQDCEPQFQETTDRPADEPKGHVLSVTSGLVPDEDTKGTSTPSGSLWTIRRTEFAFTVSCKFPVNYIKVVTGGEDPGLDTDTIHGTGINIYARPMCDEKPIASWMKVSIEPTTVNTLDDKKIAKVPHWDINKGIVKKMPAGIWGQYISSQDPAKKTNDPSLLDSSKPNTVDLLCGVHIAAPKSLTSTDFDTILDFNYNKTMVQDVDHGTKPFALPKLIPQTHSMYPKHPEMDGGEVAAKQWKIVAEAWQAKKERDVSAGDASLIWQQFAGENLGWDPEKARGAKGEPFDGDVPLELVTDLGTYYLWPPNLNVVV